MNVKEKLNLIQDKIKYIELMLVHIKSDFHEIREEMFDEEDEYIERIFNEIKLSMINKGV